MKLKEVFHGTRSTVLRFEGDSDTSWAAWSDVLITMMDPLSRTPGFQIPKDTYRKYVGEFVLKGVDFEWSNGIATIYSDLPHEIIIVFDSSLRPRKAEALVKALMAVWSTIPN